jgi:hypothetical protein
VTQNKLDFYSEVHEIKQLIEQVFELNPHSVHTLNKHKEGIYGIALDNLNLVYSLDEQHSKVEILKVHYQDNSQPHEKLRTKEWLLKISQLYDIATPLKHEETKQ